jgi:hypothetical protein
VHAQLEKHKMNAGELFVSVCPSVCPMKIFVGDLDYVKSNEFDYMAYRFRELGWLSKYND